MVQQSLWQWSQDGGEPAEDKPDQADDREGVLDCRQIAEQQGASPERARQLHAELERHAGPLDVTMTDNRRRMVSVSPTLDDGRPEVRLHHMFLDADEETLTAIVDLVQGRRERARPVLQRYIRNNRDAINFEPSPDELEPRGEHFNLQKVHAEAREHLDQAVENGPEVRSETDLEDIEITWGRRGRGSKSIRFGSFDFDQRLIRVHPALDREWVPRYFVVFIVFHELLHAVFPPTTEYDSASDERRRVHTAEFERAEKQFPEYEKARRWERRNLDRFLNRDNAS